jgi:DNA-binding MarR family transcriptional regulator
MNKALRPHNLTAGQYVLLVTIASQQRSIIGARLEKDLSIEKSSLSRNLRLLEKRGLIARATPCGRLGRALSITPEGLTVITQAKDAWREAYAALPISEDTLIHLNYVVRRLEA